MTEQAGELPELPAIEKARDLQRAFDVFNQVSHELTQAYEALQARVESLTAELAVANGELRRQYQEKQALSKRLSLLLDALPAAVLVVDATGQVEVANPVARTLFGEDVICQDWGRLASGNLQAVAAPDEYRLGNRRVSIAETAIDVAGDRLLLIHDISAAHEMKTVLERNQRLAAMGEMAASLAHQLRTPLATALLYSANLATPQLPEAARLRFAEKTRTQLKQLERLIQDVLLFARGESIGREAISVHSLLAEVAQTIEPQCHSRQVRWRLGSTAEGAIIKGERKALVGALLNLLENALQVCEAGGEVSLLAEWAQPERTRVHLRVRDTGPGISSEAQARIFEPFFTTKGQGQGTGLGLAIALGVVRAHGGTIDVHSRLSEGAEFIMELPAGIAGLADEEITEA